jgi:hypothetical protein
MPDEDENISISGGGELGVDFISKLPRSSFGDRIVFWFDLSAIRIMPFRLLIFAVYEHDLSAKNVTRDRSRVTDSFTK